MLNEGKTIAEVARSFGITETTWYRWKNTYSGTKGPYIQGLGPENRKLKTMVVNLALNKSMLTEITSGNF